MSVGQRSVKPPSAALAFVHWYDRERMSGDAIAALAARISMRS